MAIMILVDLTASPVRVRAVIPGIEQASFAGNPSAILLNRQQEDDFRLLSSIGIPFQHIKFEGGSIIEMTDAEKLAADADIASFESTAIRKSAKEAITEFDSQSLVVQKTIEVMVDELNAVRSWLMAFKGGALLVTLPNLPPLDFGKFRTELETKIDASVKR